MSKSIVKEKSFLFATRIVNMYKILTTERKEFVMSKQLLRCGTSIGANICESLNGESKADFIHKLAISQKECDETLYWLELLKATDFINDKEYISMSEQAFEILKIIRSIIMSSKKSI